MSNVSRAVPVYTRSYPVDFQGIMHLAHGSSPDPLCMYAPELPAFLGSPFLVVGEWVARVVRRCEI